MVILSSIPGGTYMYYSTSIKLLGSGLESSEREQERKERTEGKREERRRGGGRRNPYQPQSSVHMQWAFDAYHSELVLTCVPPTTK